MLSTLTAEFQVVQSALSASLGDGLALPLVLALVAALAFEFINGFHDTANAVATVIYTRSMRPAPAVIWSGIVNFLGVLLGGTAVAMGIIKLLPVDLVVTQNVHASLVMVFSMLGAAILWNFGTWYFGLPASSSHTLIGAILGIGMAHAIESGRGISEGINWGKATEIGTALLISPLIGFGLAALLLWALRKLLMDPVFHTPTDPTRVPPWRVRATLMATCTGVSFAHGSNDGQKGIGLIMLILIGIAPAHFALRADLSPQEIASLATSAHNVETLIARSATGGGGSTSPTIVSKMMSGAAPIASAIAAESTLDPRLGEIARGTHRIAQVVGDKRTFADLSPQDRFDIRAEILKIDRSVSKLESATSVPLDADAWKELKTERKNLKKVTDYAPGWVALAVALALGLGTMIGWRRIVVTIGEKIGRQNLTYAQGAAAGVVAMSTIGISAMAGVPVSTTHVLSSGVAGTMYAGQSGLQARTLRNIALAWVFTLPASMLLAAGIYFTLVQVWK